VPQPTVTVVETQGGNVRTRVLSAGEGEPLLYLHGIGGLRWDPFVDALATRFAVHAPEHPGSGDSVGLEHLDGMWDLALHYDEVLDELGVDRARLVGHSFGGMVAAEVAANSRRRVERLVLVAPLGLWRDEHPVPDIAAIRRERLPRLLFADPDGPVARAMPQLRTTRRPSSGRP
jgi:pimeloyl-ACP methyl ester carboxylesterase